jgi:hypothetical protein
MTNHPLLSALIHCQAALPLQTSMLDHGRFIVGVHSGAL